MTRKIFSPGSLTMPALVFLTVCGALVRVWDLDKYGFSGDDLLHLLISKSNFSDMFVINARDTNAPLIYFILHYLYLPQLGPITARLISLLPGIALIPAVFFLGKRYFSRTLPGLFLAIMVAFSTATVLLSQPVRQYSLSLLLLCLTLIVVQKPLSLFSRRDFFLYSVLGLANISVHYLSAVILGWIFIAKTVTALKVSSPKKITRPKLLSWFLAQTPYLITLFISFLYHGLSQWGPNSTHSIGARTNWLTAGYPTSLPDILLTTIRILAFFSLPEIPFTFTFVLLLLIGSYLLIRHRQTELIILILGPWLSGIFLSVTGLYPYINTRHSLHLLLPVLLVSAYPFTFIRTPGSGLFRIATAAAGFYLTFLVTRVALSSDYYRAQVNYSALEMPVTVNHWTEFSEKLSSVLQPGTIILADRQTGMQYLLNSPSKNSMQLMEIFGQTTYQGYPLCFSNLWGPAQTYPQLWSLYLYCKTHHTGNFRQIIIISFGWQPKPGGPWGSDPAFISHTRVNYSFYKYFSGYSLQSMTADSFEKHFSSNK